MKKPFVPPDEPTVLNKEADGTMYQGRKAGAKPRGKGSSGIHRPD